MSWSEELTCIANEATAKQLHRYWTKYSGRMFDELAGQGPFDRFTGSDLYACALLSAEIEPKAGARIIDEDASRCAELLGRIPIDVSIRNARASEVLADGSAAAELYRHLRGIRGIGPTRASKLLAVKRPGLIPIRDSFVAKALGAASSRQWWRPMLEAWADRGLGDAVDALRVRAADAVPGHVTDLRLLDVATWLSVEASEAKE